MHLERQPEAEAEAEYYVALSQVEKFIAMVEKPDFALYLDLPDFPQDLDVYEILEEAYYLRDCLSEDIHSYSLKHSAAQKFSALLLYHDWCRKIEGGKVPAQ